MTGLENVQAHNGLGIAITGMAIVFVALILISVYTALLPKILKGVAKFLPENETGVVKHDSDDLLDDELETVVAIATALQRRKELQGGTR